MYGYNSFSGPTATATSASSSSALGSLPAIDATCRFWQAGKCTRGSACRFRHDLVHGPAPPPSPPKHFGSGGGGGDLTPVDVACRFWLAGRCARGAGCRFRHDGGGEAVVSAETKEAFGAGPSPSVGGAGVAAVSFQHPHPAFGSDPTHVVGSIARGHHYQQPPHFHREEYGDMMQVDGPVAHQWR